MNKTFSQEELALMSYYKAESLYELLEVLQIALPHLTDKLAADTTADCIDKLCAMTDEYFPALKEQLAVPEMF